MSLAILSPSIPAYSETFIRMQVRDLPGAVAIGADTLGDLPPQGLRRWLVAAQWGVRCLSGWTPRQAELFRRLRRARVSAVLVNYGPLGVEVHPVCRAAGLPFVVHFHGYDAHMTSVLRRDGGAYRTMAKEALGVVAVSQRMVESLSSAGVPREKIQLVRYGVDAPLFEREKTIPVDPLFLVVGRFVDKKAPHLTLLAFQSVQREFPRARLVFGGEGALLETTRNLSRALGLDRAVEFRGRLDHDEVSELMSRATALVQHSITPEFGPDAGDSEGTPVTVLEAMAGGLAVIGTRHAGIAEVVRDGETGLLVAERDVEGLAAAMRRLAREPETARRLGGAAREVARNDSTAERYISDLRSVLGV